MVYNRSSPPVPSTNPQNYCTVLVMHWFCCWVFFLCGSINAVNNVFIRGAPDGLNGNSGMPEVILRRACHTMKFENADIFPYHCIFTQRTMPKGSIHRMLAYSSPHKSGVHWNFTGRFLFTLISCHLCVELCNR